MGSSSSKCQLDEITNSSDRCEVGSTGHLQLRNEQSTTSLKEVHEDMQELDIGSKFAFVFLTKQLRN